MWKLSGVADRELVMGWKEAMGKASPLFLLYVVCKSKKGSRVANLIY